MLSWTEDRRKAQALAAFDAELKELPPVERHQVLVDYRFVS